ncbi:hypothetical protein MRY82_01825 [bacterium]|nr:hypothetical protein [bacterium]
MWKWVQKTIFFLIIPFLTASANELSPQWESFDPYRIQYDTKTIFASVKLSDGKEQLIFLQVKDETDTLFWGLAKRTENNYSPIDSNRTYGLTPFELMQIRESVRYDRIMFDLIVGRNLSHLHEVKLDEVYKNQALFLSGVENFLLSYWYQQIEYHIQHTLHDRYPNLIEKIQLGFSFEERPINAYKIACPDNLSDINLIWLSLEHAREKSTVHANLYAMHYFLQQLKAHPKHYCNTAIWFIPILNPDGFVYANTYNEMWRKNRRPVSNSWQNGEKIESFGVDIARNFYDPMCPQDFRLKGDQSFPDDDKRFYKGKATFSDDPESNIYRGTRNSEAETRALISLVDGNHSKISFDNIVTLHSAYKDGGIFHIDDQEPRTLAEYMSYALNSSGYKGYGSYNLSEIYNDDIPGIPELYMHNRGIPMLTIELRLNQTPLCYNPFDPPLEQYIEDQHTIKHALFANIHYWQNSINSK